LVASPSQRDDSHQPLVQVQDMTVRFGRQTVLRDINLEIPRGQSLVIIGESGCGKTVLLKTLIGLVRPTHGTVVFDNQNLAGLSDRELTRQRIRFGFVFQGAALFDSMTIEQNIGFPLAEHTRQSAVEIARKVRECLADVGLPLNALPKKPSELSGGMRKRVGLARAMIMQPEIILYDEPTTGLDPIMSDVINELMLRTRQRFPVTSVIVTHDMHTVRKVADRVLMLYPISRLDAREPQMLYDGPPQGLDPCRDRRVTQFVNGEAGERLSEMAEQAQEYQNQ
jgi:phospholipid/cholesterol/gamma-HCH transport system ATP-binding protein